MRIPILIGATRATQRSGRIPLPPFKFRLEIVGLDASVFTLDGAEVVDGQIIEGDRVVELVREKSGNESNITIFAVRTS